jgi:hypothetical protein
MLQITELVHVSIQKHVWVLFVLDMEDCPSKNAPLTRNLRSFLFFYVYNSLGEYSILLVMSHSK